MSLDQDTFLRPSYEQVVVNDEAQFGQCETQGGR